MLKLAATALVLCALTLSVQGQQDGTPYTIKDVPIETQGDGSLLVDQDFTITGAGTDEDPYVVSWELLTSAARLYRPRLGQNELPSWVKTLEGKRVAVSGFVAVPVMANESDEMLVMLNQWDGCCIGVPPTPYDAVEVKLTEAIDAFKLTASPTATVTGTFKTDPYVVNGWLIGLYLMEDASVELKGF